MDLVGVSIGLRTGKPFSSQFRVCIGKLKMKVRTGRIPGVPNSSNDLPSNNVITHFYSNAVGLKMRVEGKLMLSSVPWNTIGGAGKSTGTPKRSGFFERLAGAYCA
jgi:hypothetical protein